MNDNSRMAEWVATTRTHENDQTVEHQWYHAMISVGIVTEKELELVTKIWGYNLDTLSKVLYSRTGYYDLGEMWEDYKTR
jgi:protoporphyrinogen oxidase